MASIGRLLSSALLSSAYLALATVVATGAAYADADTRVPPVLRIPGFPPVQLPPGTRGYGPGHGGTPQPGSADGLDHPAGDIYREFGTATPGVGARSGDRLPNGDGLVVGPGGRLVPKRTERAQAPKPRAPTPEEKQALIRKALTPPLPLAVARRKSLDDLYAKLAVAKDENEAKGVASHITAIWALSGSDTANLLMARAEGAAATKNYPLALTMLDKVVDLQPDWAEAWNKRASLRYLAGDLNGAMADVDHVLKLEPNHFLALNGLAMILRRTGFDKRALQVYRRELSIYPHQPEIEETVEKLSIEVEGQGI